MLALAEVMGDPVRAQILFAVAEPPRAEEGVPDGISVGQISEKIGESRRRVRYYLERLVEWDFVAVTDRRTRRGVEELYYKATESPIITLETTVRERVSVEQQRQLTLEILKAIFADARLALAKGTYNSRPEWVASRRRAEVDEQGWS